MWVYTPSSPELGLRGEGSFDSRYLDLKCTFNCQSHLFCRFLIISIWGFIIQTYNNDGFGSPGYVKSLVFCRGFGLFYILWGSGTGISLKGRWYRPLKKGYELWAPVLYVVCIVFVYWV